MYIYVCIYIYIYIHTYVYILYIKSAIIISGIWVLTNPNDQNNSK